MARYMDGSRRLGEALVRAGVLAPGDLKDIAELHISAVAGQVVTLHVKRFGDLPRIEQALGELTPDDVQLKEG